MLLKFLTEVFALDRYKFTLIWLLGITALAVTAWQEPKLTAGLILGAIIGRIPGKPDLK